MFTAVRQNKIASRVYLSTMAKEEEERPQKIMFFNVLGKISGNQRNINHLFLFESGGVGGGEGILKAKRGGRRG